MTVILHSDYSEVYDELDRLERVAGRRTKRRLDRVLETGFTFVQEDTHVLTGSLVSSEKQTSRFRGYRWTGLIKAGGPSAGVNNPVDYAIYEKRREGDHDFFKRLPLLHPMFTAAILESLAK